MATNGLDAKEQKRLRDTLAMLNSYVPRSALVGGNERADLFKLISRIEARLEPEAPELIELAADEFSEMFGDILRTRADNEEKSEHVTGTQVEAGAPGRKTVWA